MTQKIRWLTALAMLLAVGVCAVRAEEEEEVAPPAPRTAEALPPPKCVGARTSVIRVVPPAVPTLTWPIQFAAPCPCPFPAPVVPAAFGPYGQPCAACPCPVGCPCAACPVCRAVMAMEPAEYMVQLALCKATADGGREAVTQPQVCVLENQTGIVEVGCGPTSNQQSSVRMNVTVMKHGDGALLNLAVENAHNSRKGDGDIRTCTEAVETRCQVAFGASTKLLLTENADGSPRTWVEVTVKEAEHEARLTGTCPATKPCDDQDSPMVCLAECINDILCSVADTASDLMGVETWSDNPPLPSGECMQHPPQYFPPEAAFPLTRELFAQEAVNCPMSSCTRPACTQCASSACTQCAATEAVQQAAMRVCIDASNDRKCVEMSSGKKHFKATADHLTMHDGCVELQGDVRAESCDDSCNDCTVIKADTVRVERKDGGLKIDVEGPSAAPSFYFWNDVGR